MIVQLGEISTYRGITPPRGKFRRRDFPRLIVQNGGPDLVKLPDTSWLFQTNVHSLEGVGRFFMSLLDKFEVVDSSGLWRLSVNGCKKFQKNSVLS
jgi:hypothetical protein